jgi:aspartate kinase/aspartokinase/homoserine dehydrogenase 1
MPVVIKIGGSNLRNSDSLIKVREVVSLYDKPVVLVVSAFSGLTDSFFDLIRNGRISRESVSDFLGELRERYRPILDSHFSDRAIREQTESELDRRIAKLEDLLTAARLIGEIPDFLEDEIVCFGERFSSLILSGFLRESGLDFREAMPENIGLITDGEYHNASVDIERSGENLRKALTPGSNYVIPGFYGISPEGKTTVFGRGGSDYSAAVIAACTGSECLDVWKDVDGFMSGDPGILRYTHRINRLSYSEAAELSYFGAHILHPRTVEPLKAAGIPIRIFNYKKIDRGLVPFSVIEARPFLDERIIKSVTSTDDLSTLTLRGPGVGIKPGILARVTTELDKNRINIKSVITTQVAISLLLDEKDLKKASEVTQAMRIQGIDAIDGDTSLSLLAAVGEGVLDEPGVAARIFSAVALEKINVRLISFGSSRVAVYFLVNRKDRNRALSAIHNEFFQKENSKIVT